MAKKRTITNRSLHRDFGYFYSGLIISFALSGIVMNHRSHWHPEKISLEVKPIEVQLPKPQEIDKTYVNLLLKDTFGLDDPILRHFVRRNTLRISCKNHDITIDMNTGKGEIIKFINTPIISQSIKLHRSNSKFWIYYSDVFGGSLILLAITGMLINKRGRFTFSKYGWKVALMGLLFPILFLFLV